MDDLISRQAAIEVASGYCHPANIAKELAKLPSAQPEIIRCRECKHMQEDKIFHQCWCNGNEVKPNHFCGYGVRMRNNKGEWN